MKIFINNAIYNFKKSQQEYNLKSKIAFGIIFSPLIIILLQLMLLVNTKTRNFGLWLLEENSPVELATFLVFLFSGIFGLISIFKLRKYLNTRFVYIFYIFFSLALLIIAMEEIAWGQWLIGFKTPEKWKLINMQGETTLHNIQGIQGNTEVLRIIYSIGGMIGIAISIFPKFNKIKSPFILINWYIIIFFHGCIDYINDFWPFQEILNITVQRTSELIELLIAISAFLYLFLNIRMLHFQNGLLR